MKSRHILIVVALVLTAAGTARADFVLTGSEHMDVTTSHTQGLLFNASTADVLAGGHIINAYVNDEALLRVMRPSGAAIVTAQAYQTGRIAVSSGSVSDLYAYDASSVAVSGGSVTHLEAYDASSVVISGGVVSGLLAYDASSLDICGGSVSYLEAYDASSVAISGGYVSALEASQTSRVDISGGSMETLFAFNLQSYGGVRINISGGTVGLLCTEITLTGAEQLHISDGSTPALLAPYGVTVASGTVSRLTCRSIAAYESSSVVISGGSVGSVDAYDAGSAAISGGSVFRLYARDASSVGISGGSVSEVNAYGASRVHISGGSVSILWAHDTSNITLHGYDFGATGGLSLVGDEVIGTGLLAGKWSDGTPWIMNIGTHSAGAHIWAVPEPATAALLALGACMALRRRRR